MYIEIAALTYRRWNVYTQLMIEQLTKAPRAAGACLCPSAAVVANAQNTYIVGTGNARSGTVRLSG